LLYEKAFRGKVSGIRCWNKDCGYTQDISAPAETPEAPEGERQPLAA
jgi:hypothetical protein